MTKPTKTKHIEILSITNWLKKRQRFRVQIEIVKSDGGRSVGSGYIDGSSYIDVPASEKRDYSLNFFAHKEGMVQAKVFFRWESNDDIFVSCKILFLEMKLLANSWFIWLTSRQPQLELLIQSTWQHLFARFLEFWAHWLADELNFRLFHIRSKLRIRFNMQSFSILNAKSME